MAPIYRQPDLHKLLDELSKKTSEEFIKWLKLIGKIFLIFVIMMAILFLAVLAASGMGSLMESIGEASKTWSAEKQHAIITWGYIICIAVLCFMIFISIYHTRKTNKKRKEFRKNLAIGSMGKFYTESGLKGEIIEMDDEFVTVKTRFIKEMFYPIE